MAESRRQLTSSRTRRSVLVVTTAILVFATAEVACRAYFATLIGRSVLFYGTPYERAALTAEEHSPLLRNLSHRRMSGVGNRDNSVRDTDNKLSDYAKYFPHQPRSTYDVETGEVYSVTINARGFRGPEFETERPAGVVRIVTLGASSTFGYHARDDLTYPAQLQRLLQAACPTKTFEVINLGIPHLTSTQILALFTAEGAPLKPDVVTFYEGFNDANAFEGEDHGDNGKPKRESFARRWLKPMGRSLREHFLAIALGDAIASGWTHRYSVEEIETHARRSGRLLLQNLDRLVRMSEDLGFTPIIAAQQSRSLQVPREQIRGVTFQQEQDMVAADLSRQGWLGRKEAAFFVHGSILKEEEHWARAHGVRFVDVRAALDSRRDLVVSWVHLSHEGNRIVAEQLAPPILGAVCADGYDEQTVASRPVD